MRLDRAEPKYTRERWTSTDARSARMDGIELLQETVCTLALVLAGAAHPMIARNLQSPAHWKII
ncbi:hypothetical protein N7532_001329 [Penicillium argentinense]|uniref:Uncharacterized protein n=1 Tax=Penicillium argentinense TaxID=1131581 RepID=A0A9W9G2A5_9EURO|nr:uncharacterized protein N7532_001329 [Penicillium argentinense]KAJ5110794.1 hypothetical protein N7532_001329 [Penicillium argentinense]